MSEITLDCRGLACPGPVLRCLDCLEKDAPLALSVVVDDQAALENVSRLLRGKGFALSTQQTVGTWTISATRQPAASSPVPSACATAVSGALGQTVVFITAETLGTGHDELGGKLMLNFLGTLPELGDTLWRIVLVNGGVKLATAGHPCLEKLEALSTAGVSILVCGTCLTFFGLMECKKVGETTNMLDVVTSLSTAAKVIQV